MLLIFILLPAYTHTQYNELAVSIYYGIPTIHSINYYYARQTLVIIHNNHCYNNLFIYIYMSYY